jgi:hypothetical protein
LRRGGEALGGWCRAGFVLGIAGVIAAAAVAQQPVARPRELAVSATLERIDAAAGGTAVQIAPDTVASHADQLIVSVRFTNESEHAIDSIRITSPVPADVRYVPQSASGPGSLVLFSVDHGKTFGTPEELALASPDGVRAADPADYTHVRWIFRAPLDVGASGVARFRAVPR